MNEIRQKEKRKEGRKEEERTKERRKREGGRFPFFSWRVILLGFVFS